MIGTKIKQAREEAGYKSVNKFAKALNVSQRMAYYIESGERDVSIDILRRIANLTGKPFSWFVEEKESSGNTVLPDSVYNEIQLKESEEKSNNSLGYFEIVPKIEESSSGGMLGLSPEVIKIEENQKEIVEILKRNTEAIEKQNELMAGQMNLLGRIASALENQGENIRKQSEDMSSILKNLRKSEQLARENAEYAEMLLRLKMGEISAEEIDRMKQKKVI